CGGTGYSGRTMVEEALLVNRSIRQLIREGADEAAITDAALAAGMVALKESAVRLVVSGVTTVDEVLRSIYTVDEFNGVIGALEDDATSGGARLDRWIGGEWS